jgi:hypothetical protein
MYRPLHLFPVFTFTVLLIFSCKKETQTSNTHGVGSDTTYDIVPGLALSADEYAIFQQFEDTSGLKALDMVLPGGDSLINYVSREVSTLYPMPVVLPPANQTYPINTGFPVYLPKLDQINTFYNLIADITWKAQYLTQQLRGNPIFPDEGNHKPSQNKIGYASGTINVLVNGQLVGSRPLGKDYATRFPMNSCPDSIHALDNSGFIKYIFNSVKNFPDSIQDQNNDNSILTSLKGILDIKRFEIVDIPGDFSRTDSMLAGDIISFSYASNPIQTGFIGRGHSAINFFHSIGLSGDCVGNEGPDQGPVSWLIGAKWKATNFTKKGTLSYSTKRIRYIAELAKIPSNYDSTAGDSNKIQVRVYSSDNVPLKDNFPVYFTTGGGIVSSKVFTKNGIASAEWTTSTAGGAQTCTATVLSPVDNTTILDQTVFTINTIPTQTGPYTLLAVTPDNNPTVEIGTNLRYSVKLVDPQNNPVVGGYIYSGASTGFTSPHGPAVTDSSGVASISWTVGTRGGLQTLGVSALIPPTFSQNINTVTYHATILYPVITTDSISRITQTSAVSGIYTNFHGLVLSLGVCWSLFPFPTTNTDGPNPNSSQTYDYDRSNLTGHFLSSITGLAPGTTYYVRAYLTTNVGDIYGQEISFTTPN